MWIAFNLPDKGTGWMSIVAKDRNGDPSKMTKDGELSVRFRRKQDALLVFPDDQIIHTPSGDYEWRAFIRRDALAGLMTALVNGLDYTNFKNTIPVEDDEMYDAASHVWACMMSLQETPPYSSAATQEIDDLYAANGFLKYGDLK